MTKIPHPRAGDSAVHRPTRDMYIYDGTTWVKIAEWLDTDEEIELLSKIGIDQTRRLA